MRSIFNSKTQTILAVGSLAGAIALVGGCGGGGGGGSSSPPTPNDDTYTVKYVPSDALASDATAPTGTLVVNRGRANTSFTYHLRPSVIARYQPDIDKALQDNGVGRDIPNNQIPATITFSGGKDVDGSGKLSFSASKFFPVCGQTTLTVDATFLATGGASGTYKVNFPNYFTVTARGTRRPIDAKYGTCQNLPNRTGQATFTRTSPLPTATPITPAP